MANERRRKKLTVAAAMSVLNSVDPAAAEADDRYLVPPIFGPWAEYSVELAAPRRGN